jgi:hypothetical protein
MMMMTQAQRCFGQRKLCQISHIVAELSLWVTNLLFLNTIHHGYKRQVTTAICVAQLAFRNTIPLWEVELCTGNCGE